MMRALVSLAAASLVASLPAWAQSRAEGPHPDAPPEMAILGQLAGVWDVEQETRKPDGSWSDSGTAEWHWYYALDGHAIQDDWIKPPLHEDAESRSFGTNLRIYDPKAGEWAMTWIDTTARKTLTFTAKNVGDTVVMSGANAGGRPVRNTFSDITERTFEWVQEWTFDDGATWVPVVRIHATRRDPAADVRREVLGAVQQFFDSMVSGDVEAAREVLDPEGSFVSVRWDDDGRRVVRRSSMGDYIEGLSNRPADWLERMWDAEVSIHGPIAVVWTRYDFHVDGAFSHCGVDAFELLHTDAGWRLTGGIYTVERNGCDESPLGPPELP